MTVRRWVPAVIAGSVGAALSLVRVESYDEVFWLVMAERLIGKGDLPYFDVVDNKGPLLYLLIAAAVALPGSHSLGLALINGVATALMFDRLTVLAQSVGTSRGRAPWWAGIATGVALTLSTGTVTTEFLAAALVAGALASGSTRPALLFLTAAATIDPRAVLFVIPVAMRMRTQKSFDTRLLFGLAAGIVAVLAIVLAVEPLRFSLIETSMASRIAPDWPRLGRVVALALAPIVLLTITARPRRVESWAVTIALVALVVGFLGGLGIGHYWVYLPLTLATVEWTPTLPFPVTVAAVAAVSLPLLPVVMGEVAVDKSITTRTAPSSAALLAAVSPDDVVLVWSEFPHLRLPVADRTVDPSSSSNVFGWPTGTHHFLLDKLERALSAATVIVLDAPLESPPLRPPALSAALRIGEVTASPHCELVSDRPITIFRCDRP